MAILRGSHGEESVIYSTIKNFSKQFLTSWEIVKQHDNLLVWNAAATSRIFFAAMGGSSLPAELINEQEGMPKLDWVRDYRLPRSAGPQDLVIATSFSGNTEETLSAFEDALAKRCRLIALSHGGKLKQAAEAARVPWVPLPECVQPRCAIGNIYATLLACLYRLGRIASPEAELRRLADFLAGVDAAAEQAGQALAQPLIDRIPIIYGPSEFYSVCRIWKIKFNENAKVQSFFNVFPELNHNEMVGYTRLLMKPALIFLESRFMHPRIIRRMDVLQQLLEAEIPVHRIRFSGADLVQERFEALLTADYATYYLAKNYGIDPAPVEMVERFKKLL